MLQYEKETKMLKQLVALALAVALVQLSCVQMAMARTTTEKEMRFAEKIKAGVAKLGTGKEALVKVDLRDGTKLNGYLLEANENSFVVVDAKTGAATTVTYPQVKQVKGNNLSTGAKIAISIGIAVGLIVLLVATIGRS